ncbi:MAG: ShlB/FhaC/HecB family hemolysin secretion/activation protein [Pseudomonadota bacterium]
MRRNIDRIGSQLIFLSTTLFFGIHAGAAFAQEAPPSRSIPDITAPDQPDGDEQLLLQKPGGAIGPKGADSLFVTLDKVVVEGGLAGFDEEVGTLTASVEKRRVSVEDLYKVAAQIEARYHNAGYILSRVTIPPQELEDGATMRINVVRGFIESIDDTNLPERVRRAIGKYARSLIGERGLTLKQIERRLLLASRVPGVALKSAIAPGEQVGGARLILTADWRPVGVGVSTDNELSDAFDRWKFDGRISLNSVLGAGEQVYGFASTASDFDYFGGEPLRRILGAGVVVPIGDDGFSINPEYIRADINPRRQGLAAPVESAFERIAVRMRYPLILTRSETLSVYGSFELAEETQNLRDLGFTISKDSLRYFTLGADWRRPFTDRGVFGGDVLITKGVDGFGARTQDDATASGIPLSRAAAEADFSTLKASALFQYALNDMAQTSLRLRGQTTLSGALPSVGQFSLDARDALSGFALGSLNVDHGYTARLEGAAPDLVRSNTLKVSGSPYLFAAWGEGGLERPTALEEEQLEGWSLGGGMRAALSTHASASLEVARSSASIFDEQDTRVTFQIGFQY